MTTISLIIMVAIVLEGIVEYVKTIIDMVEEKEYKTAITQAATIALGIGFAFIFHLQFFNDAMSKFYEGLSINPSIDMILTGILFSRGSNVFSDLVGRLRPENSSLVKGLTETLYALDNDGEDIDDEEDEEDEEV